MKWRSEEDPRAAWNVRDNRLDSAEPENDRAPEPCEGEEPVVHGSGGEVPSQFPRVDERRERERRV